SRKGEAALGVSREELRVLGAHAEPVEEDREHRLCGQRGERRAVAARPHRRQEARRIVGDEHDERSARRFLERLEERVLGVFGERLPLSEKGDLPAPAERSPAEEGLHTPDLFDQYPLAPFAALIDAESLEAKIRMSARCHLDATGTAPTGL